MYVISVRTKLMGLDTTFSSRCGVRYGTVQCLRNAVARARGREAHGSPGLVDLWSVDLCRLMSMLNCHLADTHRKNEVHAMLDGDEMR
jgi:hypothetical protein